MHFAQSFRIIKAKKTSETKRHAKTDRNKFFPEIKEQTFYWKTVSVQSNPWNISSDFQTTLLFGYLKHHHLNFMFLVLL